MMRKFFFLIALVSFLSWIKASATDETISETTKENEEQKQTSSRDLRENVDTLIARIKASQNNPQEVCNILESFSIIFNPKNFDSLPTTPLGLSNVYLTLARAIIVNNVDTICKSSLGEKLGQAQLDGIQQLFTSFVQAYKKVFPKKERGMFDFSEEEEVPINFSLPSFLMLALSFPRQWNSYDFQEIMNKSLQKDLNSAVANPDFSSRAKLLLENPDLSKFYKDKILINLLKEHPDLVPVNQAQQFLEDAYEHVFDPTVIFSEPNNGGRFDGLPVINHTSPQIVTSIEPWKQQESRWLSAIEKLKKGEILKYYKTGSPLTPQEKNDWIAELEKKRKNSPIIILANNEKYVDGALPNNVLQGNPLFMPGRSIETIETIGKDNEESPQKRVVSSPALGTPIGYNMFIPLGEVKGVIIEVYGGNEKTQREKKAYQPHQGQFSNVLNNAGYAYITLNLPDLLELNAFQLEMSEELFKKTQASIHFFWSKLHESPDQLSNDRDIQEILTKLKDLPTWLYGASFGGRMTVRQAELYPRTFTGYMSHDAILSDVMGALSDRAGVREYLQHSSRENFYEIDTGKEYLSPLWGIASLKEPLIIFQNKDDNNTNLKTTLYFYEKARAQGKDITLYITRQGNLIPEDDNKPDTINKGHYRPEGQAFEDYMRALLAFMDRKPDSLSSLTSEWRFRRFSQGANVNFRTATFEELCLGKLFETYLQQKNKTPGEITDQQWSNIYKPIARALYHVNVLIDSNTPKDILQQEEKRLYQGNNERWQKAAEHHWQHFVRFVEEYYQGIRLPQTFNKEDFVKNGLYQHFMIKFRNALRNNPPMDDSARRFYLEELFLANPEDAITTDYKEGQKEKLEKILTTLRNEFANEVKAYQAKSLQVLGKALIKASKNPEIISRFGQKQEEKKVELKN